MSRRIVIIQGHPDPAGDRFGHALADAYAAGAEAAGHAVDRIDVARLEFPLVRTKQDWLKGEPPAVIADAQQRVAAADHLVIVFPLWLGTMPALLKGFLEQVLRQSFAFQAGGGWKPALRGRSARVVITMGMPALAYRWFFGAHSLKTLRRNILQFCGIRPVHATLVGGVEGSSRARDKALARVERLGRAGR